MSIKPLGFVVAAALTAAQPTTAQVVPLRTVPLPRWQQFDRLPSNNQAMGGVQVALEDTLADPFVNPAKGVRLDRVRFFLSPSRYSTTIDPEVGSSLPVGVAARVGPWFGAAAFSWQNVKLTQRFLPLACTGCDLMGNPQITPPNPTNESGQLVVGRTFAKAGLSIGAGVSWETLGWRQSLQSLYATGARIQHDGTAADLRLGAVKDFEGGRSLSGLLLHQRSSATHDVLFLDVAFDPVAGIGRTTGRLGHSRDQQDLWGGHVQYLWPLQTPGWQAGVIATANFASHPKLPDYVLESIQLIPRDPGNTRSFSLGYGVAKRSGRTTFGFDAVVEPAWSNTWADAAAATSTTAGGTIPAGGKTVENWFRFLNAAVRTGAGKSYPIGNRSERFTLRGGLELYRVAYSLRQRNYVAGTGRNLSDTWVEMTPTWGAGIQLRGLEIRYRGSVTSTNLEDLLGIQLGGDDVTVVDPSPVLAAPFRPVTFEGSRATNHQLSVIIPIR
ncbi:MAG: hypothetical protein AB7L66_20390 [Gemmatimonadales bacterium]